MALISSKLTNDLKLILDENYLGQRFPSDTLDMANLWANAINNYASLITPPSTTSEIARNSFYNIMLGIDNSLGNGVSIMIGAFTSYAAILSGGMSPAFIGTPPPLAIPLPTIIPVLGLNGASGAEIAEALSLLIDTWFRTGFAVNSVSGATTLWV